MGFKVVIPNDDQLFIDIDTDEQYNEFRKRFDAIYMQIGLTLINQWTSLSGGEHKHVCVSAGVQLTSTERIMLQAMLGSDLIRDRISYGRVCKGIEHPVLFVEAGDFDIPEVGYELKLEDEQIEGEEDAY